MNNIVCIKDIPYIDSQFLELILHLQLITKILYSHVVHYILVVYFIPNSLYLLTPLFLCVALDPSPPLWEPLVSSCCKWHLLLLKLNNIPLCIHTPRSFPFICWWDNLVHSSIVNNDTVNNVVHVSFELVFSSFSRYRSREWNFWVSNGVQFLVFVRNLRTAFWQCFLIQVLTGY